MRYRIFSMVLLTIILAGCSSIFGFNRLSPKQPESTEPKVGGEISGVSSDTRVTLQAETLGARELGYRTGDSPWWLILPGNSGDDSIVTASAEGYICTPKSYVVRKIDDQAYVIENGQITDKDPTKLNFVFIQIITSTPSNK